jgi:hypothetical protein
MNNKFVRLDELASLTQHIQSSFFHKTYDDYKKVEDFNEFLLSIENELNELDNESWCFLKKEAVSICVESAEDKKRGWAKLFEKLYEAKGYCFLKSKGYSKIRFIPRSKEKGVETPDLKGERDTSIILCEVKTKSISEDFLTEIKESTDSLIAMKKPTHRPKDKLPDKLKDILKKTFNKAESQLNSYTKYPNPEKYIYIIIKYDDDDLFRNELNVQTRNLFKAMDLNDINLAIHNEEKQT